MRPRAIVVALTGLLLQVATASAQSTVDFTVSGSSTVRNWTCSAQGVVAVTPGTAATPAPGFATGVQAATVTVPLKAFKCPNDEMTQHLNEAMHSDKFPEIVYRLEKYDVAGAQAQATGTMTITGVSKPVTVPVKLTPSATGVQVEGDTRLEFATFNIAPPTVFLGMLKVGPQLRITFKGTIAR
jgi:polyisoprenoid-binding protein YceI